MRSVRLDRLFASTALVLLLASAAGGALAQPSDGPNGAAEVSNAASETPPAGADSVHTANPAKSAGTAEARDATATAAPTPPNPQDATGEAEAPAAAAPAATATPSVSSSPEPSAGQPPAPAPAAAATPTPTDKPDEATPPQPAAPATAVAPARDDAASTGEESVLTPSAIAPAAAPPGETAASPEPNAVADANAPVTEQLRGLADGKFDRIIGGKKERSAIDAFYSGRNYAPLWITDGQVNARAKAAIAYFGHVDADGLDPADYPVPNFASVSDPAALAEAEIRLTTSVITYAHHAQIGRVHWSRVSGDIFYDQKPTDPAAVLANMVEAKDVGEALALYEPHFQGYLALKAKLAEFRAGKGNTGTARIPNGPLLNIGMQDQRVPLLRLRLGVAGEGGATYDKALADAVKKFQEAHTLKATGTLNAATVEALNGRQPDRQTDIIIANMERWRWMPHDLGKTYVIVNLPDFTLRVMRQGKQVWTTRVVAGKPTTPTPIMSAQMKSITVNPTWNVPPSIAANEYLPLLQQDPTILQRMGLTVSYNPDGTIHLSQPPGEQSALGRLRFNFPNKFLVYQHDSNQKTLFANDKRAESHGCMRVQDPLKYAEVLLSLVRPGEGYTQDRIHAMFGDSEIDIQFPTLIPVHLTYQTAFVDDHGKLEFREDVYGRDQALLAIVKGPERKVADIPIERKDNMTRRQLLAVPDNPWGGWGSNGRGYAAGGPNIFTRLFGIPYAQPAPVQRRPMAQPRPYYQ
jgi:L,D-transpeptidase YcbB